jgi:hypothetical protein
MKLYEYIQQLPQLPPCTPINAAIFSIAFLCIGIVLGLIISYFFKGKGSIDKAHLFIARTSIIVVWLMITIKASIYGTEYPNWFISAMFGLVVSSLDSKFFEMALKLIELILQYFKSKKQL